MEELTFQQFITEVNRTYKEEDDFYRRLARRSGLADAAFWVLYSIETAPGPVTQTDIGNTLMLSKQTINSALRKLETEGILYLEALSGRKKRACLTAQGKELAQRTVAHLMEIENSILDSWPEAQREQYLDSMQKYLTAFREKIKELST